MQNFLKFLALLAFVFFCGCKETITSNNGTPGIGDMIGYVEVFDSLYQRMADYNGVKVTLIGTPYSTFSDSSGKWHLTNIPSGTYGISFTKDHYATQEDFNLLVTGNGTFFYTYGHSVTQMWFVPNLFPNIVLRPFSDYIQIQGTDSVYVDTSGNTRIRYYNDTTITKLGVAVFSSRSQYSYHNNKVYSTIYFSKSSVIDPYNLATYLYAAQPYPNVEQYPDGTQDTTSGIANISILRSQLLNAGFSPNDQIFCCAFATVYSIVYNAGWTDPATNRLIQSGFSPNHSEVKSFILP